MYKLCLGKNSFGIFPPSLINSNMFVPKRTCVLPICISLKIYTVPWKYDDSNKSCGYYCALYLPPCPSIFNLMIVLRVLRHLSGKLFLQTAFAQNSVFRVHTIAIFENSLDHRIPFVESATYIGETKQNTVSQNNYKQSEFQFSSN